MGRREWRAATARHVSELRDTDAVRRAAEQQASFSVRRVDDAAVVSAAGELDMLTTPRLRELLREQLGSRPRVVVLDLSAVTFFASSGLATLIEAHRAATDGGVRLHLAGVNPSVRRPLQITGLADRFPVYDDVASALAEPAS